jgi:hypothetical protein
LAFLPVRLALWPLRRRRGRANLDDLAEAIEDLAEFGDALEDIDAEDVVEAVEAVVEEAAGRSKRGRAARGLLVLLLLGATIAVVLYLLRQRRDFEYAQLEPEPERPDLTPADPITPVDSTDGPSVDGDSGPDPDEEPALDVTEGSAERTAERVAG